MATFRLNISGLMGFVVDAASDSDRAGIVVIDTTLPPRLKDGFLHDDLLAHEPVLKFRARQKKGAGDRALLGDQWGDLPFRKHRLWFQFDPAPAAGLAVSLPGVPKVSDALPGAHIAAEALSGEAPIIFGQLALETGRLFSSPRTKKWSFKRSAEEPTAKELDLSVKSVWEVEGIEKVTMRAEPVNGNAGGEELTLLAGDDDTIEAELTNLCPNPGELPSDWRSFKDDDFRWHYEILDNATKANLRDRIAAGDGVPLLFPLENPAQADIDADRRPMVSNNSCFLCFYGVEPLGW